MSLTSRTTNASRRRLIYSLSTLFLITLIVIGAFAKNGWLPNTDAMTGEKTGWFGSKLPNNASSS